MEKILRGCLIVLFISITVSSGCQPPPPSDLREIIKEINLNLSHSEENIQALEILEVGESHPQEFAKIRDDFTTTSSLVPQFVRDFQDAVPERFKISNEQIEKIKTAHPLSVRSLKASDKLLDHIATVTLNHIAEDGLNIIWSVEERPLYCSQKYVEAHNAFMKAQKRHPSVTPPANMKYQDTLVELDVENGLVPSPEKIPDEIHALEVAKYIKRSDKNCRKIIKQYLIAPDSFSQSCPSHDSLQKMVSLEYDQELVLQGLEIEEKLELAFDNLDLIWSVDKQHSEKYARAHNTFIEGYRRLPSLEILPVSMPNDYGVRYAKFDLETQRLVFLENPMVPLENPDPVDLEQYTRESYELSQEIFAGYYLEEYYGKTQRLGGKLETTTQQEPDSALTDFIPRLKEILEYGERVEKNPLLLTIDCIIETKNTVEEAEFLIQFEREMREELKSDISFEIGEYELADFSEGAKGKVETFIKKLATIKEELSLQYPGQIVLITIKAVGYTDGQDFKDEEAFIGELPGDIQQHVPQSQPDRKQFLNKQLSLLRAGTVSEYAQQEISEIEWGDSEIHVDPAIVGKGEELPTKEEVSPPYRKSDPRRRICKISATFRREIPLLETSCFGDMEGKI